MNYLYGIANWKNKQELPSNYSSKFENKPELWIYEISSNPYPLTANKKKQDLFFATNIHQWWELVTVLVRISQLKWIFQSSGPYSNSEIRTSKFHDVFAASYKSDPLGAWRKTGVMLISWEGLHRSMQNQSPNFFRTKTFEGNKKEM